MSMNKRKVTLDGEKTSKEKAASLDGPGIINGPGKRLPRAAKRRKITTDSNSTDSNTHTQKTVVNTEQVSVVEPLPKVTTRVKRQAWTSIAIASFFEGLSEHGKAFERILAFMHNKHKKKQSDPFISNLGRNQVRFFYYRTWHKVSSLLTKAQRDIEREAQSPNKRDVKSKKVKTTSCPEAQSDDEETEGEIFEGDVPFDTSLDEGEYLIDKPGQAAIEEESLLSSDLVPSLLVDAPSPYNPSSVEAEQDYDNDNIKEPLLPNTLSHSPIPVSSMDPHPNTEQESEVIERTVKTDKKKEAGGSLVMANGGWHSLDLVAMICYSKLKLKYRGDSSMFGRKLFELVYRRSTTIRIKGKRKIHHYRVKVPNCPALRPCKTQTHTDSTRSEFPESSIEFMAAAITLELRPLNAQTWQYIQELSFNPRLRITTPPSRTLGEIFDFIAKKWHITPKGIFQTLRLYRLPDDPPRLVLSEDPLEPLLVNSLMTIRDLQLMVQATNDNRIPLQYEIHQLECSSITSPAPLLALLNFFQCSVEEGVDPTAIVSITHSIPEIQSPNNLITNIPSSDFVTPPVVASETATTPVTWTTPQRTSSYSRSTIMSSPTVCEYWQELSKKSPMRSIIKSPLNKYKKLQLNRVSPLKTSFTSSPPHSKTSSSRQIKRTVKRTRLSFPDAPSQSQPSLTSTNTDLTATNALSELIPRPTTTNEPSLCRQEPSTSKSSKVSKGFKVVLDLHVAGSNLKGKEFSLVKLNNEKSKHSSSQRKVEEKLHHLVTVPKKTFSSGSFSTFRLSDLLQSVQDNLKDTETVPQLVSAPTVVTSSSTSTNQPAANTKMTTAIPKGTSSILTECVPPNTLKDAIMATTKQSLSEVCPSASPAPVAGVSSITDPSPLQLYASQVAASSHNMRGSRSHDISVKTFTASPVSSLVTVTKTTTPPAHSDKKPARRRTQSNSTLRQRPVIPKPLQYLPQMTALMTSPPTKTTLPVAKPLQFTSPSASTPPTVQAKPLHSLIVSPSSVSTAPVAKPLQYLPQTSSSSLLPTLQSSKGPLPLSSLASVHNSDTPTGLTTPLLNPLLVKPATLPIATGLPQAQYLQEQLTSLLLNMLLSQQQSKLPLQQQQEIQAVLNPLMAPTVANPIIGPGPIVATCTVGSTITTPTVVPTHNQQSHQPVHQKIPVDIPSLRSVGTTVPALPVNSTASDSLQASDTVNELLRGLASSEEQASLQKLSEETVDVLPTFARAMMQMSSSISGQYNEDIHHNSSSGEEHVPSGFSDNSLIQFLHGTDDVGGGGSMALSDSNLKQIMENTDFSDVFFQLRDILKTPDKKQQLQSSSSREESSTGSKNISPLPSQEQDASNVEMMDLFNNSPFKIKSSESQSTTTARSMMEENSVDYISKFKELASAMGKNSPQS